MPNAVGDWDWNLISSYISLEQVRRYPHLCWNRMGLSVNPTLTIDDILYLQMPNAVGDWDWWIISSHIPIVSIYVHSNIIWNRDRLSENKNIRLKDLIAWREVPSMPYDRWVYPTDVVIV
jgi:hypothetical protein